MRRAVPKSIENLPKEPPKSGAGDSRRSRFCFGSFVLDPAEHRLERDGTPVPLTPRVFALLLTLVENAGHLVTKETLLERVWPRTAVEEANLSVQVSRLRRLLEDGDESRRYVETVPKFGYRFVPPVQVTPPPGSVLEASVPRLQELAARHTSAGGLSEHVRLTIQLTRMRDGQTLWSEAVEGVLQGPLDLQKRITDEIADLLSRVKVPGTRSRSR